jgi:hypothetical protein
MRTTWVSQDENFQERYVPRYTPRYSIWNVCSLHWFLIGSAFGRKSTLTFYDHQSRPHQSSFPFCFARDERSSSWAMIDKQIVDTAYRLVEKKSRGLCKLRLHCTKPDRGLDVSVLLIFCQILKSRSSNVKSYKFRTEKGQEFNRLDVDLETKIWFWDTKKSYSLLNLIKRSGCYPPVPVCVS